jgi:hypothetical protein
MCLLRNRGLHKLCASQSYGIADPSADDSSTGRGVVLGRAATKLRSIETQPLTGGSTSRRLVDSSYAWHLSFSADRGGWDSPLPPAKYSRFLHMRTFLHCGACHAKDMDRFLWSGAGATDFDLTGDNWNYCEVPQATDLMCFCEVHTLLCVFSGNSQESHNTSINCRAHQARDLVSSCKVEFSAMIPRVTCKSNLVILGKLPLVEKKKTVGLTEPETRRAPVKWVWWHGLQI